MIDGINGGGGSGGPIRGAFTARNLPAAETAAADSGQPVRRIAAGPPVAGARVAPRALVKEMASAPPVNAARVAELRAALQAGRLPIDPDAIAGAMLKLDRGRT